MKFFRRRTFIIRKKLQYSLLALTFIYAIILIAVLASSLFIPLMIDMGTGTGPSSEAIKASYVILYLHKNFWTPILLTLIAIGLHSVRISHKIAGPIYRIDLFFRDLIKGLVAEPIHLRNDDYLSEEVATINQAMQGISDNIKDIKAAQEELSTMISSGTSVLIESSKDEISAYLKDISSQAKKLGNKIDLIKVVD
jgi:methyl-accepting chemotaxis protein